MSHPTFRQQVYNPLCDKTVHHVLRHLFVTEFGYADKVIFAEAMIERILAALQPCWLPTAALQPGQFLWLAVSHDGHKHAHQLMRDMPLVPVVLDLVTDDELQTLAQGQSYAQTRRQRIMRLLRQAFAQGGVLAETDLSALLLSSVSSISEEIRRLQAAGQSLPYRGTVQDVGLTLTHKVQIIRLFEQGYLEPEICSRLSPTHSLQAVTRYIQAYKNVIKLVERGFSAAEINAILHMSVRLVYAYVAIARQHHPDILLRNPHFPGEPPSPLRVIWPY